MWPVPIMSNPIIYTQQEVDTRGSFPVHRLRKDPMERWDMARKIDSESPETGKTRAKTLAFDGRLFGSAARDGRIGKIETIDPISLYH